MSDTTERTDETPEVTAEHIDNRVEKVSDSNAKHSWTQRGVEMVCPGDSKHYAHGFHVPAELVFREVLPDGSLKFENVKTGGFVTKII